MQSQSLPRQGEGPFDRVPLEPAAVGPGVVAHVVCIRPDLEGSSLLEGLRVEHVQQPIPPTGHRDHAVAWNARSSLCLGKLADTPNPPAGSEVNDLERAVL